jgi:hypothetical protein
MKTSFSYLWKTSVFLGVVLGVFFVFQFSNAADLDDGGDVYGGSGINDIYGGSGIDDIYGGSGINDIYGGSGIDDIYGGSGSGIDSAFCRWRAGMGRRTGDRPI